MLAQVCFLITPPWMGRINRGKDAEIRVDLTCPKPGVLESIMVCLLSADREDEYETVTQLFPDLESLCLDETTDRKQFPSLLTFTP